MTLDPDFAVQMKGRRLATAEILYHLPDHPHLLQSYVWQDYDMAPFYPVLHKFLDFWRRDLEGPDSFCAPYRPAADRRRGPSIGERLRPQLAAGS